MLPGMLVLLLVVMALGLLLLVAGVRGRKVNDHPVCRQCHFDLQGTYPEVVTCPECGAGLKREKAVVVGARRRMPLVAVLGALCILTPLVPVGAVAFAALTGGDVNEFKPLAWIMWEAKNADARRSEKLAAEVMNRILSQKLSASQYDYVIGKVLEMQGNRKVAWTEAWGDVIDRAEMDGVLTAAQRATYAEQAAVLELKARPRLHAGGVLPVEIDLKEARVAPGASEMVGVRLVGATIDGAALERVPEERNVDPFLGGMGGMGGVRFTQSFGGTGGFTTWTPGGGGQGGGQASEGESLGTLTVAGSKPQAQGRVRMLGFGAAFGSAFGGGFDGTLALRTPDTLKPGKHSLSVELELTPAGTGTGGVVIVNGVVQQQGAAAGQSRRVVLQVPIEVVGPGEDVVAEIALDGEKRKQLLEKLRPSGIEVEHRPTSTMWVNGVRRHQEAATIATVRFPTEGLPAPIAYDVYVRTASGDTKLGELTSGKLASEAERDGSSVFSSSFTITINGVTQTGGTSGRDVKSVSGEFELDGSSAEATIVLKPSQAVAASTIDLEEFAGEELVFENVPLVRGMAATDPLMGMGDPFADMNRRFEEQRRQSQRMLDAMRQQAERARARRGVPSTPAEGPDGGDGGEGERKEPAPGSGPM